MLTEFEYQRDDFEEILDEVREKACTNYHSLSIEERMWYNIEVFNEWGLYDTYTWIPHQHIKDVIFDLENLGFKDVADIIIAFNLHFSTEMLENIAARNAHLETLSNDYIDQLEERFSKYHHKIELALLKHLNTHF